MKNFKLKYLFGTTLLLLLLGLNACDFENPVDGLEIRLNNITRNNTVAMTIVDVATNKPIDGNATIKFTGENAGNIISVNNEPIASLQVQRGIAIFAVNDNIEPSGNNPVKINFVIEKDGYMQRAQQLILYKTGISTFKVNMMSYSNLPEGVASTTGSYGTAGATGTTQDFTIYATNGTQAGTGIKFAAGTVFKDINGNVLTGNVEARMTYFDPTTEGTQRTLTNMITNLTVTDENGNITENAPVYAGGMFTYSVTVGGVEAASAEGSEMVVETLVPENLIDPETGNPIDANESFTLYQFDSYAGNADFLQNSTSQQAAKRGSVLAPENTNFYSLDYRFQNFTHQFLSIPGFDMWHIVLAGTVGCDGEINVVFNNLDCAPELEVGVYDKFFFNPIYEGSLTNSNNSFYLNPSQAEIGVIVTDPRYEETDEEFMVLQTTYGIACGEFKQVNQSISVGGSDLVNNIVKVKAICTDNGDGNDKAVELDGLPVYYSTEDGSQLGLLGTVENGQLSFCFEKSKKYNFLVYYDGVIYQSIDYISYYAPLTEGYTFEYTIVDEQKICDDLN